MLRTGKFIDVIGDDTRRGDRDFGDDDSLQ